MQKRATREAYGETLVELAKEGKDVVVVDADLAASTTSSKLKEYDENRFFDVGIAEQNMIDVAAGLSITGRIAYTASFAVFGVGRCYDQIRNTVCDSNLNVKICPTHAGITVGEDGATHEMLEDIAIMRTLPHMHVFVPADYYSAQAAIRLAAEIEGPVYVRLGRAKVPVIYDDSFTGGAPYARILREGSDVSLMACGVEVAQALEAAELLEKEGISAEVVDVFSIKPLAEDVICASAARTGHVVTCEEHMIRGGMGSAIAELLSQKQPTKMNFIGMEGFGTSAPGDVLMKHYGLDAASIAHKVKEFLKA